VAMPAKSGDWDSGRNEILCSRPVPPPRGTSPHTRARTQPSGRGEESDGVLVSTQVVNGLGPVTKSRELVLGRRDMAHVGPKHSPTMNFSASPMGCLWVRALLREATVRGDTEAAASGGEADATAWTGEPSREQRRRGGGRCRNG
jgi:hypothetical protein